MSTKENFKKVESMLYGYKNTKAEINILKRDLEILENNYNGVTGASFDEHTSPTNKFNSAVENEVINRQKKINNLKAIIRLKEIEINNIEDAVETLNDEETLFITERYFNHKSNKYVASLLNIVEQSSCLFRSRLINKLIPLLIR